MAEEQKQPLILALGRGYNGFYCPETRFHLVGIMRPQGVYPSDKLSEDVKRALRGGTLVDVNKVLTPEQLKPGKLYVENITTGDRKKAIQEIGEEITKKEREQDAKDGVEGGDYVVPNLGKQQGDFLSEPDILASSKKDLLTYIEKTDGLSLEGLELTSRSTADDVKEALIKHFGYDQKPVDVEKEAQKAAEDEK